MHEDPQIPNYGEPGKGPELEPGMVLAIEPMVNAGGPDVRVGDDNWAVYSADGSLAAHFEFTVAVTEDGPRVLTPGTRSEAAGAMKPPRSTAGRRGRSSGYVGGWAVFEVALAIRVAGGDSGGDRSFCRSPCRCSAGCSGD